MSYVYSGFYYWATGRLYEQALNGRYWSSTIYNSSDSYNLNMNGSRLIKANSSNKRVGRALRCVTELYGGAVLGLGNPTDSDAGTNRTNAVSRDNLMNGASLGYSGNYSSKALNVVGVDGHWQSSTLSNTDYSYNLRITTEGMVNPRNGGNKFIGRSVRCVSSPLVALVQDLIHCRTSIRATTTGLLVGFTPSRWVATTGHLV